MHTHTDKTRATQFRAAVVGTFAGTAAWIVLVLICFRYFEESVITALSTSISAGLTAIALIWIIINQWTQAQELKVQREQLSTQLQELQLTRDVLTKSAASAEIEAFSHLREALNESLHELSRSIFELLRDDLQDVVPTQIEEIDARAIFEPDVYQRALVNETKLEEIILTRISQAKRAAIIDHIDDYLDAYNTFWNLAETMLNASALKIVARTQSNNYKLMVTFRRLAKSMTSEQPAIL
ncbi:MAG: hypothetical protein AAFY84_00270 [Pseudomonadota bacterium]